MTKKVINTSGFAQDVILDMNLSDSGDRSQTSYFINKLIKDIDWNTANKMKKITELEDASLQIYMDHKEHGEILDNDKILEHENDIAWHTSSIASNVKLRKIFLTASQELFPATHEKSEADAKTIDKLEAAYQAKKQAS